MHQTRVAVFIHATWATWDRLPLLVGEVEQRVHRAIGAKCDEPGVNLVALGGVEDHVHILIRLPASISLADVIGQVKGASAHLITHEVTHSASISNGRAAMVLFSVSARNVQQACNYINNQREHHRLGTIYQALEPVDKLGISEETEDSYAF
ncbi:MAG: IS200/IS605 family transposase [Thermomicrobiales bacterium]